MHVEEGFLDGLNVEFAPGLNVVIGARGTGKTSLIELLRFCLGSAAYTAEVNRIARAQALAVLESGVVTLELDVDGQVVEIVRSASDRSPRGFHGTATFAPPIVLSQSEIEKLALDETGRLRLVDDFRPSRSEQLTSVAAIQQLIASLTVEVNDVAADIAALQDRIVEFTATLEQLDEARDQQRSALDSLESLAPIRARLTELNEKRSTQAVQVDALRDAAEAIDRWAASLSRVGRAIPHLASWPVNAGPQDELAPARTALEEAGRVLDEAVKLTRRALDAVQAVSATSEAALVAVDEETRPLRRQLEEASAGAGELSKRVEELTQHLAQRESITERLAEVNGRLEALLAERRSALERLESARLRTFDERTTVAGALNKSLGPLVRVTVERAGLHAAYTSALADAFQGSGLHHNTLAPRIAERMSPRELAEAVERSDVGGLAALAEIPSDRAVRVIAQLAQQPLSGLLTAWVDDRVDVSLLDGSEPKPIGELSTGQRCTVILPILLQHQDRVLVMDQPEDNLDNAFVVDTLVRSIRDRPASAQLIVTTHNPNIPVLGEAERVLLLASTGRRGFISVAGALEDRAVVDAITSVMEGGKEAFARRAKFYRNATKST
jgi:ABC-type lipoprotein export system ATPase subunit/predicted nuclease with TOPRIM domain